MNTMSRSQARHRAIAYQIECSLMSIDQLHLGPATFCSP